MFSVMDKSIENLKRVEAAMDGLGRAMRNTKESLGKGLQLTRTQLEILMILSMHPTGQTTGELAECLFFTQSSITQTVDTLFKRNLVERHPDKHDRRVIRLQLSTDGRKIADKIHTMKRENIRLLVSNLTDSEVDAMVSATEKFTAMLKENQQRIIKGE